MAGFIGKVLLVLRCLESDGGALTLSQISRVCGLPKTTVHRIVTELLTQEALVHTAEGYAIQAPGGLAPTALKQVATPYLVELFTAVGGIVRLVTRQGPSSVCLLALYTHSHTGTASHLPEREPAHLSHEGRALLAGSGPPSRIGTSTMAVAGAHGSPLEGFTQVLAPLLSPDGRPMAVASVTDRTEDLRLTSTRLHLACVTRALTREAARQDNPPRGVGYRPRE